MQVLGLVALWSILPSFGFAIYHRWLTTSGCLPGPVEVFSLGVTTGRCWAGCGQWIGNILWVISKQRNSRKTSTCVSSTKLKPLTVWIITNYGKLLKKWEYQTILPVSWETCMWVKKQQVESCMERLIGSGLRKEYHRAVCCHPVYLTYVLSTSWKMLAWMSDKLESR